MLLFFKKLLAFANGKGVNGIVFYITKRVILLYIIIYTIYITRFFGTGGATVLYFVRAGIKTEVSIILNV